MQEMLNDQTITINCPNCNKEQDITISQIGSTTVCNNCNCEIDLVDDGFSSELNKVDKQLNDMFD